MTDELLCKCMDQNCPHRHYQDTPADAERLRMDLLLHGNAYTVDGQRVPPESVVVYQDTHVCDPDTDHDHDPVDERCQGIEPVAEIRTQDELLTALDELLDNALHDDHCYITPNDTVCVCVIGRLRAVLPPCGAVQIRKVATQAAFGGEGRSVWKCLRNAHPASPDRHYFGED